MKYTLINKFTGKLFRNACTIFPDTTFPINEDVLKYVAITEELENIVENNVENTVLDGINTYYNIDTDTWNVITKTVSAPDIVSNRAAELAKLKIEAQRFYTLSDIPESLKTAVATYITELNNFVIPTDTSTRPSDSMSLISWPTKPWV
jgi:hypothetical protein